jgi:type VI secretion system (T6SS) effector TldE1-like protein
MVPSSPLISNAYASLFDRRFSLGYTPGTFVRSAALAQQESQSAPAQLAAATPQDDTAFAPTLPVPRPRPASVRTALLRDAQHERAAAAQAQAAQPEPSIFERLFGKPKPVALAYAASDDAGLGRPVNIVARYDSTTAVYDISAKTVYLPDGRRLEAHSGLGQFLDDPHHVDLRMRGATPPTIYDLSVREGLFHGVRALRLNPEDEGKVYGRAGLLAHTFMLGPNGDSNGCVSFRDYEAFLQAYLDHKITRLAVVSSLD